MAKHRAVKWPTVGKARLEAWRAESPKHRTQTAIGLACGASPSTVSRWLSGDMRPEPGVMREAIERLTGIPHDAWKTVDERRDDESRLAKASAAQGAA